MSILKLLFALNPKNLKLVKAAEMTPKMAQEIDSFLGKMGAVVNIGKYNLTPSQAKYWRAQRKELTKYENKLNEMRSRNKLKKKEGIETLPEADVIDFPVKPKPPEGEPFKDGGPVDKKDEDTVPLDPNEFDEMFRKMFSEWEWEKKKDSWKDKDYADGGRVEMMAGGITKIKKLLDLAKKTKSKLGEASKTDLKKVRAKAASDKKSTEELAKSEQIPVRDDTVKVKGEVMEDGTPDYEYYRELLDNDEYDVVKGDETLEQLEAMLKEQDDYMKYMYGQYKTGKLDPQPGEINRSRLNFLKDKAEEAEMSGRSKIITPDEIDELNFLEKKIRKMDLDEKVQDLNKKLTDEEIMELKDLTDLGYAYGGLATLFEERR